MVCAASLPFNSAISASWADAVEERIVFGSEVSAEFDL